MLVLYKITCLRKHKLLQASIQLLSIFLLCLVPIFILLIVKPTLTNCSQQTIQFNVHYKVIKLNLILITFNALDQAETIINTVYCVTMGK